MINNYRTIKTKKLKFFLNSNHFLKFISVDKFFSEFNSFYNSPYSISLTIYACLFFLSKSKLGFTKILNSLKICVVY